MKTLMMEEILNDPTQYKVQNSKTFKLRTFNKNSYYKVQNNQENSRHIRVILFLFYDYYYKSPTTILCSNTVYCVQCIGTIYDMIIICGYLDPRQTLEK